MNNETVHAYHGSSNMFDEFNFSECGEHGGSIGAGCGLYFSTSKSDALTYGPVLYEVTLRLGESLSNHEITLKAPHFRQIIKAARPDSDNWPSIASITNGETSDTGVIAEIVRVHDLSVKEITDALTSCGYTHTEDHITPDIPDLPHYIVYDPSRITILNVTNIGHD
jgi:hypothetical protein